MLRCRWECTYWPRFSWPSTVRISREKDVLRRGAHVDKAALLAGLAQGDGEKILLAVGVAAQPRPRAVDVVPCHQGAVAAGVDDPRRGRHVEKRAGAQENIFMRGHGGEHRLPVAFFLFVEGPVGSRARRISIAILSVERLAAQVFADHPWVFRVGRVEALQGGEAGSRQFHIVFDKKAAGGEVYKDHGRPSAPPTARQGEGGGTRRLPRRQVFPAEAGSEARFRGPRTGPDYW